MTTLLFCLSACKKEGSSNDRLLSRTVGIYLRDSTSNNLLVGNSGAVYSKDSVKIYEDVISSNTIIGAAVPDASGNFVITAEYFSGYADEEADIVPAGFVSTSYIYLNSADVDTLMITKNPYSDIFVKWNNRSITSIPALDQSAPYLIAILKKP